MLAQLAQVMPIGPAVYYVLILMGTTKAGFEFVEGAFPLAYDCQVAEGVALTEMTQDPKYSGVSLVVECRPMTDAVKI